MSESYTVSEHYEGLIKDLVDSGRYNSVRDVLDHSLQLLEVHEQEHIEKLAALRKAIQEGLDSGEYEPWDVESIKAEGRRRLAALGRA